MDYYAILGVSEVKTIRRAYRTQARKHHPDCGGSHERMVQINTAWFILSDPDRRSAYDQARTQQSVDNRPEDQNWQDIINTVRQKAQQYPRDWAQFEKWMGHVADDVAAAEYGATAFGDFGNIIPRITGSQSGEFFIMAGALVVAGLVNYFEVVPTAPAEYGHDTSRHMPQMQSSV